MRTLKSKITGQFYQIDQDSGMELADGEVAIFPLGGGFVQRARLADFTEEEPPHTLVDGIACVDGEGDYPCIFDPYTKWNGWSCPFFTRDIIEKVADDWNMQIVRVGDDEYLHDPQYSDDPQDGIFVLQATETMYELVGVCWDCEETAQP